MVAVIAEQDDDGVVPELESIKGIEDAADLRVHVGGAGVIGAEKLVALAVAELGEGSAEFAEADGEGRRPRLAGGRTVEHKRVLRIQVEILRGRDERIVGLHETGSDNPRAVTDSFNLGADGASNLAVGLIVVGASHRTPIAPAQFSLREIPPGELLPPERSRDKRLGGVPRTRQVHPLRAERIVAAAPEVEDFAKSGRMAAVGFQQLRQRDDVGQSIAEQRAVIGDDGAIRAKTGEERAAARVADGILHVSALKADGARGETINIGRLDGGVAVTPEGVAQIVDRNEQDVQFRVGRRTKQADTKDQEQRAQQRPVPGAEQER